MSENLYYDFLFPSLVTYTDSEIINKTIIKKAKEILDNYSEVPFYSKCQSTVNTFGSVLDIEEFFPIKNKIIENLSGFCDLLNIDKSNLKFFGSWLNNYEIGGYQDLHLHSDSMISGVFYLAGTNEKDLIFQSPSLFYQPLTPKYTQNEIKNCWNVEYPSITGRCYLFMSSLMHRTLPATKKRMSLSFNIKY